MRNFKYFIPLFVFFLFVSNVCAKTLTVESEKQEYDDAQKLITLTKNVKVNIDDVTVRSPKAFLTITKDGKANVATFTNGAHAIQITPNSKSETKANILKLSLISKEVTAEGNVQSKMDKLGKPTITIKSDYQSFNVNTNLMEVKKNAVLTYGDIKGTSKNAKIWLAKEGGLEFLKLIDDAVVTHEKIVVKGNEVNLDAKKEIVTAVGDAYTDIKVDDTTHVKIWANNQQYNNKDNSAMASGTTIVHYEDYVAKGPKAVMLADPKTKKPNKIIFAGRSRINEGGKSITADKIVITMNPKNFVAEGNVKTQINDIENVDSGNKGL